MNNDIRRTWIDKYNKDNNNEYSNYTFSGKYLVIQRPSHHLARKDGYVYIHQLQAEKKIGRKLNKGECVHHINENKYDNDINNLMVFHSNSDHTAYHNGNYIYEIDGVWFANKRTIKINNYSQRICPICGKELMDNKAKMCKKCYLKERAKNIPSKTTLEDLIVEKSVTEIGKIYSVADNTVRKWCKKYDLPFRQKDIADYKNKRVA